MVARDILAHTNPALGAVVLFKFVEGYFSTANRGPEFALAFLPVPVALSAEIASTFEGTEIRTGLLRWRQETPFLQLSLHSTVAGSSEYSRQSLSFALGTGALLLEPQGRLGSDGDQLTRIPRDPVGVSTGERPFTVAHRLGQWCGKIDNTANIFSLLGLKP